MRNYQGLFEEIDSCTAIILNAEKRLAVETDPAIRVALTRTRIEALSSRAHLILDLHAMSTADFLSIAA